MNNLIRKLSLLLALVMCLTLCAAGVSAEDGTEAVPEGADGMAMFAAILSQVPELQDIDWEGYYTALSEKIAAGEELFLEDMLPAEAWSAFGSMMNMVPGSGEEGEDSGMLVDLKVTGNEMVQTYTLKEQADEDACARIAESVAATFESPETKQNMKSSMEQMAGSNIDITKVVMTLRFLNADESVIYEKTYTYDSLMEEPEPAEEPAA